MVVLEKRNYVTEFMKTLSWKYIFFSPNDLYELLFLLTASKSLQEKQKTKQKQQQQQQNNKEESKERGREKKRMTFLSIFIPSNLARAKR